MVESFGYQGSGGHVVSTFPLMYLFQQLSSLFRLDALLEDP
jgi:hypothetical protein